MPARTAFFVSGIVLFLFGIACPGIVSAQNNAFENLRKIPLTSPDVASLMQAVEFPVSHFNGRVDVSVPIYTIQTGDLQLPISLAYNSGGIRVSEEASWVGLGWALNAGGVISRQIQGQDDDLNINGTFKQYYPDAFGNTYQPDAQPRNFMLSNNLLYKPAGQTYTNQELCPFFCTGELDGEPDIYSYNFGKYSGKFTGLSTSEIVDISCNNIKFARSGNGMIATDPEGFRYEFMAVEWSATPAGPTKTAFYLTKITSPSNRTLTLKYKTFREFVYPATGPNRSTEYIGISTAFTNTDYVTQMPVLTEEYIQYQTISSQGALQLPTNVGLNRTFSTSSIRTLFLDSILFENGAVKFQVDSRKDLFGVRLTGITVSNKAGAAVMSATFDHDYFTARAGNEWYTVQSTQPGGKSSYDESYRRKRLKLKGVTVKADAYKFYYNEGADGFTLPYKSSFEQDYWGYYNGKYGNTTLVPDFTRYRFVSTIPAVLSQWVGANRDPKFPEAQEGTLKKIMHPTKGLTEFEYDLHEFVNAPSETVVTYNTVTALNTTTGVTTATVDIVGNNYVDLSVSLFCNQPADADPTGTGWDCGCVFPPCNPTNIQNAMWVMIEKVDPVTGALSPTGWEYDFSKDIVRNQRGTFTLKNVYITAGRYKLTANYPDNKVGQPGVKMASISLSIPVTTNVAPQGKGGGLRLTSLSRYDPASKITSRKNYTYEGGMMMHFPTYYSFLNTIQSNIDPIDGLIKFSTYRTHTLYANPRQPYSYSANGSHVGYGKIKEFFTGEALGRTEYVYNAIPDKYPYLADMDLLPGTPSIASMENGFLKGVHYFDNTGRLLKVVANTPVVKRGQSFWAFKVRRNYHDQGINYANMAQYLQFTFYPIQVGKLLQASATETTFDPVNNVSLTSARTFQYNNRAFLQSEEQARSDGATIMNHYRYPEDFTATTGWLGELKTRNMIGMPLESVKQVNGKLVAGNYTTYALHDDIVSPYQVYAVETTVPVTLPFIAPTGTMAAEYKLKGILDYDNKGNLNFSRADQDINTGYKWGYDKMYPIAVCKNAVPAQFFFEDFEGNGTLVSNTVSAHTGKGGYSGTVALASLFSSTTAGRTYRLSYFKLNGTVWVHTDEPYTGQSVSGVLDDIRIYPQDGEITTYTYIPLVGISSITNPAGNTTFYSYDSHGRLTSVRDRDGKILKAYEYYYSSTLGEDNSVTYPNVTITQNFYKQCTTGEGSLVPYTVPAGKYTAGSPEEANALAQAEIDAQGQLNANTNGTCTVGLVITSIVNGSGNSFTVNFTTPPGINSFINLFAKDPVTGRPYNDRPYAVPLGSTSYTGTIEKGRTWVFSITAGGTNYPSGITSADVSFTFP